MTAELQFICDDGGRAASRRPKQRNDCVVRAIAVASCWAYDDVYDSLAGAGRKCGRGTPKAVWKAWLNSRGWLWHSFPAKAGERRVSLASFCHAHPSGRWVVQCAGHLVAVVDGAAYDDGPPRQDACVYAAWRNPHR